MNIKCNAGNRDSLNWAMLLRISFIFFIALPFWGCEKKQDSAGDSNAAKELSKVEGVSIQYADGEGMTSYGDNFNGEYFAKNITFEDILIDLWPHDKIEIEESSMFAGKYFNLVIKGDNDSKQVNWEKFKNAFEKSFDISIKKKKQLVEAKVLSQIPSSLKIKKVEGRSGSFHGTSANGYKFESKSLDELTEVLEEVLGVKVINETGLEGKYDFEVKMDIFEPETFSEGLKEIGLELSDEKRELDVVLIEELIK